MNIDRDAAEAAIAAAAAKATPWGAAGTFIGWAASSEGLAILGLCVAVGGMLINWYYRAKADRRAEKLLEVKMARLRQGLDAVTDSDVGNLDD